MTKTRLRQELAGGRVGHTIPARPEPGRIRAHAADAAPPHAADRSPGAKKKTREEGPAEMTREEILSNVREVLVDALAVDDEDVTEDATLIGDLGAESIDMLDISFKLEQAFDFKIEQGELFPENVAQDPEYVQEGKVTDKGLAELKAKMPHVDFTKLEADRSVTKVADILTVGTLVNFCEQKLQAA
ncbi:MAG: acyl carrier protein [Planctomycetota bacterium]